MPEGGCFCGAVRISYEGEPISKALCHCLDCRKITGSAFSTNVVVRGDGFKVLSGTPKQIAKISDSGKQIVSKFCGDCGTTLWRESENFGTNKIIKAGTLDGVDTLNNSKPSVELYTEKRVEWVPEVAGTIQKAAM